MVSQHFNNTQYACCLFLCDAEMIPEVSVEAEVSLYLRLVILCLVEVSLSKNSLNYTPIIVVVYCFPYVDVLKYKTSVKQCVTK